MNESILIVDDEPDITDFLSFVFQGEDLDVTTAGSSREALDLFQKHRFDLVLTDIRMPVMDGLDMARRIKEYDEDTEIIFITGHATVERAVDALKSIGASDFFTKPLNDVEHLILSVKNALERRRLKVGNQRLLRELRTHQNSLEDQLSNRTEALHREIQNRKEMTVGLLRAKDAAEAASRAKSEFLANMSHEIRTPMNAIVGFADLLNGFDLNAAAQEYIRAIRINSASLLRLIDDILDLARIETGKMELIHEPVDLREIFKEIEQIYGGKAEEKGIRLEISVDENIPARLMMDAVRVRQILVNLVGNGVKFTEAGTVRISAQNVTEAGRDENTPERVDLKLLVQDTGIGISQSSIGSIFDIFQQIDGSSTRRYEGIGLGLAIVKRLTELMNGKVVLLSQEGEGTTFEILLPKIAADDPSKPQLLRYSSDEMAIPPQTRILIVDDIDFNRKLLIALLKDQTSHFMEAENGREALDLSRQQQPDIILMDIRMPVMDGYEAAEQFKADSLLRTIPLIAVSASAMKSDRERIEKAGFDAYLPKPLQRTLVIRKVVELLERKW